MAEEVSTTQAQISTQISTLTSAPPLPCETQTVDGSAINLQSSIAPQPAGQAPADEGHHQTAQNGILTSTAQVITSQGTPLGQHINQFITMDGMAQQGMTMMPITQNFQTVPLGPQIIQQSIMGQASSAGNQGQLQHGGLSPLTATHQMRPQLQAQVQLINTGGQYIPSQFYHQPTTIVMHPAAPVLSSGMNILNAPMQASQTMMQQQQQQQLQQQQKAKDGTVTSSVAVSSSNSLPIKMMPGQPVILGSTMVQQPMQQKLSNCAASASPACNTHQPMRFAQAGPISQIFANPNGHVYQLPIPQAGYLTGQGFFAGPSTAMVGNNQMYIRTSSPLQTAQTGKVPIRPATPSKSTKPQTILPATGRAATPGADKSKSTPTKGKAAAKTVRKMTTVTSGSATAVVKVSCTAASPVVVSTPASVPASASPKTPGKLKLDQLEISEEKSVAAPASGSIDNESDSAAKLLSTIVSSAAVVTSILSSHVTAALSKSQTLTNTSCVPSNKTPVSSSLMSKVAVTKPMTSSVVISVNKAVATCTGASLVTSVAPTYAPSSSAVTAVGTSFPSSNSVIPMASMPCQTSTTEIKTVENLLIVRQPTSLPQTLSKTKEELHVASGKKQLTNQSHQPQQKAAFSKGKNETAKCKLSRDVECKEVVTKEVATVKSIPSENVVSKTEEKEAAEIEKSQHEDSRADVFKSEDNKCKEEELTVKTSRPQTNGLVKLERTGENTSINNTNKLQAVVRPRKVLSHVIDRFVIHESSEPFPVQRSSLLTEFYHCKSSAESQSDSENSDGMKRRLDSSEAEPLKKNRRMSNGRASMKQRCEFCKKPAPKRFCNTACNQQFHQLRKKTHSVPDPKETLSSAPASNASCTTEDDRQSTSLSEMSSSPSPIHDSTALVSQKESVLPTLTSVSDTIPDPNPTKPVNELPSAQPIAMSDRPVENWSIDDVCQFIGSIKGCESSVEEFRSAEIDGQALLLLTDDCIMSKMKVKLGPALKICQFIAPLKLQAGI